jgi:AAA+ superfamily predicted ATPase
VTTLVDPYRWQALGDGYLAPAGSVTDPAVVARVVAYKRDVAGAYRSVSPGAVETALPPGPCVVSEKVDGETWFLHRADGTTTLVSPAGKAITAVPLTHEADTLLAGWSGLLAGELYAACDGGRPRVFDLHAALGGGEQAQVDRLRFAAFDLLLDGTTDATRTPFADRVDRLHELLQGGHLLHAASFETVTSPTEIAAVFERVVTHGGAEGVVVHARDDRIFKVKPEIALDAVVVAYAGTATGVSELLLALLAPDRRYQHLGRVRLGWSHDESRDLAARLGPLACASTYRTATDHGSIHRWVRPALVVEVRCNDLLAVDTRDQAIRRMRLDYDQAIGWSPLGPTPSVSLINAVFLRVRDDKRAQRPDVRFEQVTDLVEVATPLPVDPAALGAPETIRREVYAKLMSGGLAVRKLVAWRTNRTADPAWPAFVVHFTDYAPDRNQPLKTDVRVASNETVLHALADDWLAANVKRGWDAVSVARDAGVDASVAPAETVAPADAHDPREPSPRVGPQLTIAFAKDDHEPRTHADDGAEPEGSVHDDGSTHNGPRLAIAFARSSSPTFPIVRRRLDALAPLGSLEITRDDKGREAWFELRIDRALVQNTRRFANLLAIIRHWKSSEVSLDGEALGRRDLDDLLERLDTVRRCWLRRKGQGADGCRGSCGIGCEALRIWPAHESLRYTGNSEPCWWGVGTFDGERVTVDKPALHEQVAAPRNAFVRTCPFYAATAVAAKIDALPNTLAAADATWTTVYSRDGKPAWVWPRDARLPHGLHASPDSPWRPDASVRIDLNLGDLGVEDHLGVADRGDDATTTAPAAAVLTPEPPARCIPPTRYTDVIGQDAAVEAVRDLVELPLKYADLFERIGAKPQAGGILLGGPAGTGKTLLARAVAGECNAHVEIVSGPALLSKWVGESEAGLRAVFERARALAPAVILFDEVDSLAPRRNGGSAPHDVSLVAQLLVLLDGLEGRGQVFVLGTTNRPDDIDPALRRPGRFDQVVWMGLPDQTGRAALFAHHLRGLTLEAAIDRSALTVEMAAGTAGCTGADVAFVCQRAALLCVKEAAKNDFREAIAIGVDHLRAAVAAVTSASTIAAAAGRFLRAAG